MAFPITCPSCGKAFQLATEIYEKKVSGKVVSIKCKQCQRGIRIDATQPGELKVLGAVALAPTDSAFAKPPGEGAPRADAMPAAEKPPAAAAPVRARQPTLIGMMSPSGEVVTPSAGALWAVDSGGQGDDRELTEAEIARELREGKLSGETLAWREGQGDWLEIKKIPEFQQYLTLPKAAPAAAPKVEAPLPAPPAAKVEPPAPKPEAPTPPAPPAKVEVPAPKAEPPTPPAPAAREPDPFAQVSQDETTRIAVVSQDETTRIAVVAVEPVAEEPTRVARVPAGLDIKTAAPVAKAAPAPAPARGKLPSAPGISPIREKLPSAPGLPPAREKLPSAPGLPPPRTKQPSAPGVPPQVAKAAAAVGVAAPRAKMPSAPGTGVPNLKQTALGLGIPGDKQPSAARGGPPPAPPPKQGSSPMAAPPPRARMPSRPGFDDPVGEDEEATAVFDRSAPDAAATAASLGLSAEVAAAPTAAPALPPVPTAPGFGPPPLPVVPPMPAAGTQPYAPPPSPPPIPDNPFVAAPSDPPLLDAASSRPPPPAFTVPKHAAPRMGAAPAPTAPQAPAPNPFNVVATTDVDFATGRSKRPLIIGGAVAAVAAIGIIVAVASSGGATAPPPAPAHAPVTPEPTATIETRPNPLKDTVPQPVQPSETGSTTTQAPSGNFSDLFAAGAEKAGGGDASTRRFDAEEAKKAVSAVLRQVAACKEAGGSVGQANAAITFSGNGAVSSVTIGDPFAGNSTGTCIISSLKQAKMAPFSGLPGTITYAVSIR